VTNPDQVSQTVNNVIKDFNKIDILVNDAAYNIWIPFQNLKALTYEEWNKIININLTGPMLFMKAVAEPMKLQGAGRIVNIASVAGMAPVGSSIAYGVSKAGLIQLTKGMAVGLAPDNILVNCIAPGYLEGTRMSENLTEEYREQARLGAVLQRAADKDDIAEQVVTFCKTDTTTGQTLVIDGGRLFH
jgi:3-oxoacyl-[acyl-carrier protein] reductase